MLKTLSLLLSQLVDTQTTGVFLFTKVNVLYL